MIRRPDGRMPAKSFRVLKSLKGIPPEIRKRFRSRQTTPERDIFRLKTFRKEPENLNFINLASEIIPIQVDTGRFPA